MIKKGSHKMIKRFKKFKQLDFKNKLIIESSKFIQNCKFPK